MDKKIKVIKIIYLFILLSYIILSILKIYTQGLTFILAKISTIQLFLELLIMLIIGVIIRIVTNKKIESDATKKQFNRLIIFIIVANILVPFTLSIVEEKKSDTDNQVLNKVKSEFKNMASNIVNKIKPSENKVVYLYDDLLEFDDNFKNSPLGNKIDNGSYISYYDNNLRFCFSDGKYLVEEYDNKLTAKKINKSSDRCTFRFEKEAEEYLKYYINKIYGLNVKKVTTNQDCLLGCKVTGYTIKTNLGDISASLNVKNNKITVNDDYSNLYISNLLARDLVEYMKEEYNYTIRAYSLTVSHNINSIEKIDINSFNYDANVHFKVLVKREGHSNEKAKEIANAMVKWYKKHKIYGITDFILLEDNDYELKKENNYEDIRQAYNVEKIISCKVSKDGEEIYE